ncbi:MAG: hypothetical protein B0W54_17490 [Cellvibrio sp. 79]|nr:MAG: hypothetical protein B0W54_17490 [Cellvibrio sp. 79]
MKNLLIALSLMPAFLFSIPTFAGQQGWVTNAKIARIVATVNGGINIRLIPELSGCVSQSGYGPLYASLYPDHPGKDQIHSILLAAYMSNTPIAVYFNDDKCTIMEIELGGR